MGCFARSSSELQSTWLHAILITRCYDNMQLPMYVKPQEGWVIPYSGKHYTSATVQCKLHAHTCFLASTESMQLGSGLGSQVILALATH